MITFDFINIEESSYDYSRVVEPVYWPAELDGGAFFGGQIFIVNSADFSGDYPILGFARWMNVIAFNLKKSGQEGYYEDPELEKPSRTEFSLEGSEVVIVETSRPRGSVLYSARAELEEFCICSEAYLDRVFTHCCKLLPILKDNEEVHQWLNDYPS